MKKFVTVAIATCAAWPAAYAAPLSDAQQTYVAAFLGVNLVNHECREKGYTVKEGRLRRFQDELGVNDQTARAVMAAAQLFSDQKYNRSDLIPEVTQLVKPVLAYFQSAIDKGNFCDEVGGRWVKEGVVQKVQ